MLSAKGHKLNIIKSEKKSYGFDSQGSFHFQPIILFYNIKISFDKPSTLKTILIIVGNKAMFLKLIDISWKEI